MAKIATVLLGWEKSPSADVAKVVTTVTVNGATTTTEFGPEVVEHLIEVKANSAVSFTVTTYDSEGLQSVSETHSFTLGDLEAPQPATNLFHTVVGIRDEEVVPPPAG